MIFNIYCDSIPFTFFAQYLLHNTALSMKALNVFWKGAKSIFLHTPLYIYKQKKLKYESKNGILKCLYDISIHNSTMIATSACACERTGQTKSIFKVATKILQSYSAPDQVMPFLQEQTLL